MTGREIVQTAMGRKGESITSLAEKTGNSPQGIWRRLNERASKDVTLAVMHQMLSTMGYKIVVIPNWCFVNPDGFVYTPDNGDNKEEKGK